MFQQNKMIKSVALASAIFVALVSIVFFYEFTILLPESNRGDAILCRYLGNKLLNANKSPYGLTRCSIESYPVENSNEKVYRVYVVAGRVTEQNEHECGYWISSCSTSIGWFDSNSNLVHLPYMPLSIVHDPALYASGCVSRQYNNGGGPKLPLVKIDNEYWWKIEYKNQLVGLCLVNGISYVNEDTVRTNIAVTYTYDYNVSCLSSEYPSTCQTRDAIVNKSINRCHYDLGIDDECVINYFMQTGDRTVCGTKVHPISGEDYTLDCDTLPYKITRF